MEQLNVLRPHIKEKRVESHGPSVAEGRLFVLTKRASQAKAKSAWASLPGKQGGHVAESA